MSNVYTKISKHEPKREKFGVQNKPKKSITKYGLEWIKKIIKIKSQNTLVVDPSPINKYII